MSYCNKIHYSRLTASTKNFASAVDELLMQLPKEDILRIVLFGIPESKEDYANKFLIFKEKVIHLVGKHVPVLSWVSQPVLDTPWTLEVHSYHLDGKEQILYRQHENIPYVVLDNEFGRFLFAGGIQENTTRMNRGQQAIQAFCLLKQILNKESFPVNSIVRQWNYIEQITGYDETGQHYQSFNNARTTFYANTDWTEGYPAATGIGTNMGGVLIDVDAAVFHHPNAFTAPIDNKLQIAAHAYSGKVLEESCQKKTTPKFERAKSLNIKGNRLIYISGTAAIRGEESLKGVGLKQQLHITMDNISQLTGNAYLTLLRVYLKNQEDYDAAKQELESYQLDIPIFYLQADVCRDELLIEIEGIATERQSTYTII